MKVPRSQGFHDRAQSSRLIHFEPFIREELLCLVPVARGRIERLADGEEADRDDHGVDAVEKFGNAEGEARLPGLQVDADEAEGEPDEETGEAAGERVAEDGRDGGERQHHQREVFGRAEAAARPAP